MLHDLRFAWRALRHRRGTTLTAVLCLALGIGANTTLFGVIDALLFRPPAGVASPEELLRVRIGTTDGPTTTGAGPSMSYPQTRAVAERLAPVAEVAVYAPRTFSVGAGKGAEPLAGVIASASYFDVLGVRPYRGRYFAAATDDIPGAAPVAVLSAAAWNSHFGSDPRTIGSTIEINGVPVTVIGVTPPGFVGVDLGEPDVWLALGAVGLRELGGPGHFTDRLYWLQMVARRSPGVSASTLEHVVAGGDRDPYAATSLLPLHTLPVRTMFFGEQRGHNPVPVWAIGITLAVLLLACATVANLLLAQGVAREREVAVRLALGASRHRILRQLLLENLMIAIAAGAAAVLLAVWSERLVRMLPVPAISQLVNPRVGVLAFAVAMLATFVFGLVPALWTARGGLDAVLRQGAVRAGHTRLQHVLMALQIALSFMLLVSAGLFLASFRNVLAIDTGFQLDHLLEVRLDLPDGLPTEEARQAITEATDQALTVPGVLAAAPGSIVPFFKFSRSGFTISDGRPPEEQPTSQLVNVVGVDYFRTMGIRMAAGRPFDAADRVGAPTAVVTQTMARQLWRDGAALGACIRLNQHQEDACVRVIGITDDVRMQDLRGDPTSMLFLLDAHQPPGARRADATIFVRTRSDDPVRIAEPLRRQLQQLRGGLPFIHVRALDDRVRPSRIQWEVAATLFTGFGALATILAAVGLFMLISFMVCQRTHELGIRSALGSPPMATIRLVLGSGARVAAAGIAVGAAFAVVITRLLANQLYGVKAADPVVWFAAAGLLMLVALAATWLPARAASRLDPLVVLRDE